MENFQDVDDPQAQEAPQPVGQSPAAQPAAGSPALQYGGASPVTMTPSPITINLIGQITRSQQAMVNGILGRSRLDAGPEAAAAGPSQPNRDGELPWEWEALAMPAPRGPGRPPLSRRGGSVRGRGNRGGRRVGPYDMPQFTVTPLAPTPATVNTPPIHMTRSTQTQVSAPAMGCSSKVQEVSSCLAVLAETLDGPREFLSLGYPRGPARARTDFCTY